MVGLKCRKPRTTMRTGSKAGDWRVFEPYQLRRGKGLDPDREETYDWSRHQKERKPESQFRASPRKRKVTFSRGPVKGEILITEWPNRSRQLHWARN